MKTTEITKQTKVKLYIKKKDIITNKKKGFSLIEVVIAITLMAILSGIAMTSYTKTQDEAKKKIDYTTAANIATAAQLADADGKDIVSVEALVSGNYLQSNPQVQQKDAGKFTVSKEGNTIVVKLGDETYYPKGQ